MVLRATDMSGKEGSATHKEDTPIPEHWGRTFVQWLVSPITVMIACANAFIAMGGRLFAPLRLISQAISYISRFVLCIQLFIFAVLFARCVMESMCIFLCMALDTIAKHKQLSTLDAVVSRVFR